MRKLILTYGSLLFACWTIMVVFEVKTSWGKSLRIQNELIANSPKALSEQNNTGLTVGTWTGTKDTKWDEPSNWSDGQVPGVTTDVTISPGVNQPIIDVSAECNNITISAGATLTISAANVLSVYGNWSNTGNFIANESTVIFGGDVQTIKGTNTFQNVTIAGKERKSFSLPVSSTVNGVMSIEGISPLLNTNPNYGPNATLRYNVSSARTMGLELPATFAGKGGIIIDNTGPITLASSMTLNDGVPLSINSGASLIVSGQTITFGGDFHNYGTFNLNNTKIVIGPGNATQFIDGFSTTGIVSMTKSGGSATLMGNITGGSLETTGSGTLNLGAGLTHTFTGTWVRGSGTLNGGSSALRFGSGFNGTAGLFNPEDGTVEWFSSAQTSIYSGTYNNLIISGSGIKTSSAKITINRMMTIEQGAQFDQTSGIEKSTSNNEEGHLNIHGLLRVGYSFPVNFSIFNMAGGTVEYYSINQQYIDVVPYNNLILSGDTKNFKGAIQINGNLTIKNGAKCNLSTYVSSANTLTLGEYGQVSGDWGGNFTVTYKNSSFFTNASGKLTVVNNSAIPGVWLGKSPDWAAESNWSDGHVPTRFTDAIITANGTLPEINGMASCKNLFISPASTLVIKGSNTLSVSQDWTNKGTFTTVYGTVVFDGADQVINQIINQKGDNDPFNNLTLGNTGIKTLNNITVLGILSIEGTASVNGIPTYGANATLQYNTIGPRNTGTEWPDFFTATASVIINGKEAITLTNAKTLYGHLSINSGATLNTGTSNYPLVLLGNFINSGAFNAGSSAITLSGGNTQIISGFTTTGNVKVNKTIGTIATLLGTASFNDLTITTGQLVIEAGSKVTVNNLTNKAGAEGLTLLSDASQTGSLIINGTASGSATLTRSMTAGFYHLITSPLGGQTIKSFLINNPTIQSGQNANADYRNMRDYNPTANDWNDFFKVGTSATTGNIIPSKGYSIRVKSSQAHQVVFTGTLPNGDITTSGLTGGFWNCIGNPYTSAIMINSSGLDNTRFLENNINNLDPAFVCAYVWDPATNANQYTSISNATDPYNLQQGQAFMVKIKSGVSAVSFNRAMQTHDVALELKSTDNIWPTINLIATADSINSSTTIAFHEGMTPGLDVSYDAGLLKAGSPIDLYTRLVDDYGIPFAIQALPSDQYGQLVIPVGVDYPKGGAVTFSAKGVYLPAACRPILEDRLTGIKTDLTDQTYTADLSANTAGTGRFYLHTSWLSTGVDSPFSPGSFSARFVSPGQLSIRGMAVKNATISLTDVLGKIIFSRAILEEDGSNFILSIPPLKAGVYVVTIRGGGTSQSVKLVQEY